MLWDALSRKRKQFSSMQEYLTFMDETYSDIAKRQWKLTQAVAHSKRERKIDRRKSQLLKTIDKAMEDVRKAGSYGGEEFKEETLKLMKYRKNILNEEFEKVIDLQKISEQSYDAMEAYFMAQEELDKKSAEVQQNYQDVMTAFAEKNNINFVEEQGGLGEKMRIANEVFDYKSDLYLLYFKAQINQVYLFESIAKNDVNGIQQNYNALQSETQAALEKLKSYPAYKNSTALPKKVSTQLEKFQKTADKHVPQITDFLILQKDFEQLQTTIDKTPQRKRTKKMINDFNKKVDEVNKKADSFNKSYKTLVNQSNACNQTVTDAFNSFVEKNVPKS